MPRSTNAIIFQIEESYRVDLLFTWASHQFRWWKQLDATKNQIEALLIRRSQN